MQVAGKEVPAGSYAILSRPAEEQWEVMFFPYETGAWTSYVEKTPAVTVTAEPLQMEQEVETFTIELMNYSLDGADLVMMWGQTMVPLPIVSNAREGRDGRHRPRHGRPQCQ